MSRSLSLSVSSPPSPPPFIVATIVIIHYYYCVVSFSPSIGNDLSSWIIYPWVIFLVNLINITTVALCGWLLSCQLVGEEIYCSFGGEKLFNHFHHADFQVPQIVQSITWRLSERTQAQANFRLHSPFNLRFSAHLNWTSSILSTFQNQLMFLYSTCSSRFHLLVAINGWQSISPWIHIHINPVLCPFYLYVYMESISAVHKCLSDIMLSTHWWKQKIEWLGVDGVGVGG